MTSCNEALNHSGDVFYFSSMVVFLNTLLLKYYRAHNIHHCTFYPISNVGLGFCYSILKGKFLFIFNIFGEKIGRALIVWLHITVLYWVFKNGLVSSSFMQRKTLIVSECCTVFSILDMFKNRQKLLRNIKLELYSLS